MINLLPNPRYERKFTIQGLALPQVLALVRRHPAAFHEAYPSRLVNNVYLDTPGLTSYHDHVNGAPNRVKIRVRWYGNSEGEIPCPILERKLKRGMVGGKMAKPLPRLHLNGEGVRPQLARALASDGLPENWRAGLRCLQPSLFSRYRRHYFVSADNRFRLTIDSELSFAAPQNGTRSGVKLNWPLIVVELKFAPEHAEAAPLVTNPFPFRIARCSKYILGIEQAGL